MTQEEINKAFEGRWRIKGKPLNDAAEHLDSIFQNDKGAEFCEQMKHLCRDFFEAGILIGERSVDANPTEVVKVVGSISVDTAIRPTINENGKIKNNIFNPISFDAWWNLYDKKCGREKCEKKWAKLSPKEQAECLEATPAYVASTPDKQYRKHPLTYLNGKCWNDEIIIRNGYQKPTIEQQRVSKLADILAG